MTLCELRTAEFHSIPLECEAFWEESGLSDRAPHGICVEWAYLLDVSISLLSHAERFPGALSPGPVILGTCVKFVCWLLFGIAFLLTASSIAQLCFAYQRSNEKGMGPGEMFPLVRSDLCMRPRARGLQECYYREDRLYPSSCATRGERG